MVKIKGNISIDSKVWVLASHKYKGKLSNMIEQFLKEKVEAKLK